MILVRSRGAFFEAMIRALKEARVKTAGADRLTLRDSIAVMDLIAVGRSALLPDDDLTLAAALKSPLVGLDDDDLMALAPQRAGSLARALAEAADQRLRGRARSRVEAWRRRAETHTPYMFYARLVGEDGGRRALLARLGPEVADAIDEFMALALAHEQKAAPSLHAFLAEIEAADFAIKRDMEGEGDSVRVMTVHAAKGLEAPIVFLPDTCSAPIRATKPSSSTSATPTPAIRRSSSGRRKRATIRRRSRALARGRATPPRANIAACSMSR